MFWKRAYHQWRFIFWVAVLAVAAQAFFMFKAVETVPFFLYHMFGFAHERQDTYPVLVVRVGDRELAPYALSNREAELVFNSVDRYLQLVKQGDYLEPVFQRRFERWVSPGTYALLRERILNSQQQVSAFPAWWAAQLRTYYPPAVGQPISVWRGKARFYPSYSLMLDEQPQLQIPR